jgi:hypothetical protein
MRRKPGRSPETKRLLRKGNKLRGCSLCHTPLVGGGRVSSWLDLLNPDREAITFLLCRSCSLTDYAEQLNQLHRQTWAQRHKQEKSGAGIPENISLLRR